MPYLRFNNTIPAGKPNIEGLYEKEPEVKGRQHFLKVSAEVFQQVKDFPRCYAVQEQSVVQVRDPEAIYHEGTKRRNISQAIRKFQAENSNTIEFDGHNLHVDNSLLLRINLNLISDSSTLNVLAISTHGLREVVLDRSKVKELAEALELRSSKLVTKYGNM